MTHPESLTTGVEERLLDTKQAGDMTKSMNHSFGSTVRRERERLEIGLRQMAKMISVSPTYLSKVERDEFPPPAEDKVKAIAKIIGHNTDELLALAGRVASDLTDIIKRHPQQMASFIRAAENELNAQDVAQLSSQTQEVKDE